VNKKIIKNNLYGSFKPMYDLLYRRGDMIHAAKKESIVPGDKIGYYFRNKPTKEFGEIEWETEL